MIECKEREKRTNSVIISGLGNEPSELQTRFNDVVSHLLPTKHIYLQDIVPIKPNLRRAKITNRELRRDLLSTAKNLRQPPFPNVFITRDLTYKQREERKKLATTRTKRRMDDNEQPLYTQIPSETSTVSQISNPTPAIMTPSNTQ